MKKDQTDKIRTGSVSSRKRETSDDITLHVFTE